MLFEQTLTYLPTNIPETIIYVVSLLGIMLLVYGVFLETERRQDLVFMIGSACLLVYAVYASSTIFVIAMAGIFIASLVEFVEIMLGIHKCDKYELKAMIRHKKKE